MESMMAYKLILEVFDEFFDRLMRKLEGSLKNDFPDMVIHKGSWENNDMIFSSLSIYLSHDFTKDSIDPVIFARENSDYIQLDMDISLANGVIIKDILDVHKID